MKEKIQQLIATIKKTVFIAIMCLLCANVTDIYAAEGFASLEQRYPSGTTWNDSYMNRAWECHGFACLMGHLYSDTEPYTWAKTSDLNNLKAGDLIRFNRPHSILVTGVHGDTITYVDCNWVGKNKIAWNQTIQRGNLISKYGSLQAVWVCPVSPAPVVPAPGTNCVAPQVNGKASIDNVRLNSIDGNGLDISFTTTGRKSKAVAVNLDTDESWHSEWIYGNDINIHFERAWLSGKPSTIRFLLYSYLNEDILDSTGEEVHFVTYGEYRLVTFPMLQFQHYVDKFPNLVAEGLDCEIVGWCESDPRNPVVRVVIYVNGVEYAVHLFSRQDIANVFPNYQETNNAYSVHIQKEWLNAGSNNVQLCAYTADGTRHLLREGIVERPVEEIIEEEPQKPTVQHWMDVEPLIGKRAIFWTISSFSNSVERLLLKVNGQEYEFNYEERPDVAAMYPEYCAQGFYLQVEGDYFVAGTNLCQVVAVMQNGEEVVLYDKECFVMKIEATKEAYVPKEEPETEAYVPKEEPKTEAYMPEEELEIYVPEIELTTKEYMPEEELEPEEEESETEGYEDTFVDEESEEDLWDDSFDEDDFLEDSEEYTDEEFWEEVSDEASDEAEYDEEEFEDEFWDEEYAEDDEEPATTLLDESFIVSEVDSYTYDDGREITPFFELMNGEISLQEGTDYIVSYSNNINAGTATAEFTGIGNYTGTISIQYEILPKEITAENGVVELAKNKYAYTGKAICPELTSVNVDDVEMAKADYKIKYANNKKIGQGSVKVVFEGNYTGELTVAFKIFPQKVSGVKQANVSTKSVKLTWNAAGGSVTGYEVYRSASKNGRYNKIKTSQYTNLTVQTTGNGYYYRVRAYKKVGAKRYYGEFSNPLQVFTKPVMSKATVKTSGKKVTLSWKQVSGVKGYEIYIANAKNAKCISQVHINASKKTYTKSLASGTYTIRLRCYRTLSSGKKIYSSYVTLKNVKIK